MPIDIDGILNRFDKAQKRANEANEERYENLLQSIRDLGGQLTGTYDDALQEIGTIGDAQRERIQRNYTNLQGAMTQDLVSSGLFNTTMRPNVRRSVEEDRALQEADLSDRLAAQRAGVLQNRAGAEFNVGSLLARAIEGRTDAGPDLGLFANLLRQAAANDQKKREVTVGPSGTRGGAGGAGGGGFGGGGGGGGGSSFSSGGGGSQVSGGYGDNTAQLISGGGTNDPPPISPIAQPGGGAQGGGTKLVGEGGGEGLTPLSGFQFRMMTTGSNMDPGQLARLQKRRALGRKQGLA